ncbi:hypothetical protein BLNAU_18875 [Blattamonas nauphoetae]|uniref:SPRY domain-containing protein n=1 Tax=Blattamonas nauphoetae TaxID=2049346 RepID=A0ABQ9X367_9EUKA|nr:hypothetical protein BLNAU_18875 [Blattamonas nauphoetae]
MDATSEMPKVGECLGYEINNSLSLDSQHGELCYHTPSHYTYEDCHSSLRCGDSVRMEIDMQSALRSVQFFVNGRNGKYYMTGIPTTVFVGFSVDTAGTAFRIDRIETLHHPTPIAWKMREAIW